MTKDKERDDALIAEAKEVADKRHNRLKKGDWPDVFARHLLELERSNWTPPAKPDRYQQAWDEAQGAYGQCDCDRRENCPHAVAVLRRHFAPPSEVVEAAEMVQRLSEGSAAGTYYASAKAIADFILKGGA